MNVADDAKRARHTVLVSELTDGILDPAKPMLGPLVNGGTIVGNTAPGCWGPMITPRIRGGHEVTRPVFIADAEPGDSVVIRIRDVNVTSFATASGHDRWVEGHYLGDPYAAPRCPNCGKVLRIDRAVEIGHIFRLGYRYTESMGARVLDKNGKEVMPIMGCYGIGIERILTAAVEQSNDENGFWLPPTIAPFEVVVAPVNVKDEAVRSAAEDIAKRLEADDYDLILDDRDERPGVKFKDADLVGIPFRITVGKKVTEGTVEVVLRSTREVRDVRISAIVEFFAELLGRSG